ncbi:MAG: TIGR01777 family oxidoreductase [Pseudomonadota bacterium]
MTVNLFVKRSGFDTSAMDLFAWHERPGALERLTPPWIHLTKIHSTGGIQAGARVRMKQMVMGIPMPLEAEHVEYVQGVRFRDRLVRGPFSRWEHTHVFVPFDKHASFLEDRVEYALPVRLPPVGTRFVRDQITRMFQYRHTITREDLKRHRAFGKPVTVLISGAGGVLGSALIPFLTTGGHRVIRLVRRRPVPGRDEVFWDPGSGILDLSHAGPIDAVINLNGTNIGEGRWTPERRKQIIQSRVLPTALLANTISRLKPRPSVFITASATGFYGEAGTRQVTEEDPAGDLFISKVCRLWEEEAQPAVRAGIRTVFARIGVVLTPRGGALQRMLPPFLSGCGARVGHGRQRMSWVSVDDLIYSIYHIMGSSRLQGPVNLVSPSPVTNAGFTRALAGALARRAPFAIPEPLIDLLWGDMGREVLMTSTGVLPGKLMDSGFGFCHPVLETALGNLLGKTDYAFN